MSRISSSLFAIGILMSGCQAQNSLPWKFGLCKNPVAVQNFNATAFFTKKWYQQSQFGNFFTQAAGICPTIDSEISSFGEIRQLYYQYEPWLMLYSSIIGTGWVADVQNDRGYVEITYDLLNGILPYRAPITIIGTDYDNWAVLYSCRQQLFLKLELSWTLTRTRNDTAHQNIIDQNLSEAGLSKTDYIVSNNVGCGPNEPSVL